MLTRFLLILMIGVVSFSAQAEQINFNELIENLEISAQESAKKIQPKQAQTPSQPQTQLNHQQVQLQDPQGHQSIQGSVRPLEPSAVKAAEVRIPASKMSEIADEKEGILHLESNSH